MAKKLSAFFMFRPYEHFFYNGHTWQIENYRVWTFKQSLNVKNKG